MVTAILAIFMFVVLIFPHELGHFICAKLVGVQVNEFAFGMGPAVWKKQGKETVYSIRILPIGGFCAMEGEDEESENERAFNNQPAWAKLLVLAAGSAMNVFIAVLILSIMMCVLGSATTTIGKVSEGFPAHQAGIRQGDRVLSVDGHPIGSWGQLSQYITDGDAVDIVVKRDGKDESIRVTPIPDQKQNDRYVIGVTPEVTHNPILAVKNGCMVGWGMTVNLFDALKQIITGAVGADELSGPVGMVSMVHQTWQVGMFYFFYLLAFVSLNLAIFNMLPFPALDGGRICFVLIRLVTGKAITDRTEAAFHVAGMVLLLTLMVLVTWNDIGRLIR